MIRGELCEAARQLGFLADGGPLGHVDTDQAAILPAINCRIQANRSSIRGRSVQGKNLGNYPFRAPVGTAGIDAAQHALPKFCDED